MCNEVNQMGREPELFLLGIILYVFAIFYIRWILKGELTYITHKRMFRHKLKKKLPFFRRFFLVNYIDQFKKKWMWHYVVFIAETILGMIAIILHVLRFAFEDSMLIIGLHRTFLILSVVIYMLTGLFPDTRRMRRKK